MTFELNLIHHVTEKRKVPNDIGNHSVPLDSTVELDLFQAPHGLRDEIINAFSIAGVVCSYRKETYKEIFGAEPDTKNNSWIKYDCNITIHPDSLVKAREVLQDVLQDKNIELVIDPKSDYKKEFMALLNASGIKLGLQKPIQKPTAAENDDVPPQDIFSCFTLFGAAIGCYVSRCNLVGAIKGAAVGAAVGGVINSCWPSSPTPPKSPSFSR